MITNGAYGQPEGSVPPRLQITTARVDAPPTRPRLFCLCHVGGSAAVFDPWQPSLESVVELRSVRLPGRGPLLDQTPIQSFETLVEQLLTALRPLLDRPWAIFGHSFGAAVAYEVSRRLHERHQSAPKALIVAGRAPDMPAKTPRIAGLPDNEFIAALSELNGIPSAVLECRNLMARMLPSLRADFAMYETYQSSPVEGDPPLDCPITACGGDRDPLVGFADILGWRRQTSGRFECRMFSGDHFFPFKEPLFVEVLTEYLHATFESED